MSLRSCIVAASLCGLVAAAPATAATVCKGQIKKAAVVYPGGELEVDWGFGGIRLCNLGQDITLPYAVTKDACKALQAQVFAALANGLYFSLAFQNTLNCAELRDPNSGWLITNVPASNPAVPALPQRFFMYNVGTTN